MTDQPTIRRQATADLGSDDSRLAVLWVYPERGGRLTPLHGGRTILGRDFGADVRLPGEQTSRQHAEVVKEGALVFIRDLGSTNGVFVDARQVEQAPLAEGRTVRIGDWVGVVVRTGAAEDEAPIFGDILPGYFGGPKTRAALEPLRRAATSDLPVIIEGETGSGKEGVARAAHEWSGRSGAFVAVNCAALPETLAEGELFGYRKGAFTSADRANPGHFQAAHRGTLFLDEVADLPPSIQPKLLRVLEQREVTPLGEARAVPIDVRVVVAAQAPLANAVREKRFRADLFARLNGLTVRLPPLRSRIEEVPHLFARLLAVHAAGRKPPDMDAGFVERLCCYDWPLNIRELSLLARRLLALHGDNAVLKRAHIAELAEQQEDGAGSTNADEASGPVSIALTPDETTERQRIIRVLEECAGSQTAAARKLNISRSTLVQRIIRFGIPRPRASRDG
jgi:DNA-binding NtrC family response regulator